MKSAAVYCKGEEAGVLARFDSGEFEFRYLPKYRKNPAMPSIAATLPKREAVHRDRHLFAFFYGLLAEGVVKEHQCRMLKIDENDHFTRLTETCALGGAIGAVTVKARRG